MNYKITQLTGDNKNGYSINSISFEPKLMLLSSYLGQIYSKTDFEWCIHGVNNVLTGKSEIEERDIGFYGAEIQKDITRVYITVDENDLSEDVISTVFFKNALEVWGKENGYK